MSAVSYYVVTLIGNPQPCACRPNAAQTPSPRPRRPSALYQPIYAYVLRPRCEKRLCMCMCKPHTAAKWHLAHVVGHKTTLQLNSARRGSGGGAGSGRRAVRCPSSVAEHGSEHSLHEHGGGCCPARPAIEDDLKAGRRRDILEQAPSQQPPKAHPLQNAVRQVSGTADADEDPNCLRDGSIVRPLSGTQRIWDVAGSGQAAQWS